jgi:hypothetical protein
MSSPFVVLTNTDETTRHSMTGSDPGPPSARTSTGTGWRASRGPVDKRRPGQRRRARRRGHRPRGGRPLRQRPAPAARRCGGTRNLLRAAGIPHLVDVSFVGVDRVSYRYYQAKLQAERLIQASGLGWTTLRATQFHQLVLLVAQGLARLPLVPVPAATSFQPIDAGEVADPLAGVSCRTPQRPGARPGRSPGPHRCQPAARLPAGSRAAPVGPAGLAARRGVRRLPAGPALAGRAVGRRTWEQFLAEQLGRQRPARADPTVEGRA